MNAESVCSGRLRKTRMWYAGTRLDRDSVSPATTECLAPNLDQDPVFIIHSRHSRPSGRRLRAKHSTAVRQTLRRQRRCKPCKLEKATTDLAYGSHVSSQSKRIVEWNVEPKYAYRDVLRNVLMPRLIPRPKEKAGGTRLYSPGDIRSDSRPASPAPGRPSSRALLQAVTSLDCSCAVVIAGLAGACRKLV